MMEKYRWQLRVASRGDERATVYARKHQFEVGASLHFDREYPRVTALEYLLGGIGADIVNGFRSLLTTRRVAVDHVEAQVTGTLNNPLTFLGVIGEQGHPGVETVRVNVFVSTVEPEERVLPVWEEMLERSPVVNTFRHAVALELHVQVVL
jgi:hypothetical protein